MKLALLSVFAAVVLGTGLLGARLAHPGSENAQDLAPPSANSIGTTVQARTPSRFVSRELAAWTDPAETDPEQQAQGPLGFLLPRLPRGEVGADRTAYVRVQGERYLTNAAWSRNFADPYVRGSLAYAYTYAPLWRKVADATASKGTTIRWANLPPDMTGWYEPDSGGITLSPALQYESGQVAAAALAHECYHASHRAGSGVAAELQEEIDAYAWEAYVWSQLPRPSGSPTALETHLDSLVRLWRFRELNSFVVTMPGYQQAFFGTVLVSP